MSINNLLEKHIEIRLLLRRETLTSAIQRSAHIVDAVPPDEDAEDAIDFDSDSFPFSAHEASILQLNAQVAELADVNAALKRMAAGTFGRCTNCGMPMSFERLTCQPIAQECLACETESEEKSLDPQLLLQLLT